MGVLSVIKNGVKTLTGNGGDKDAAAKRAEEIREKQRQLREAEREGDSVRAEELRREIRDAIPPVQDRPEKKAEAKREVQGQQLKVDREESAESRGLQGCRSRLTSSL